MERQVVETEISAQTIISCIDLTLLDKQATAEQIQQLQLKGEQFNVAALCIYPQHLAWLSEKNSCKWATVLNFPSGEEPAAMVMSQLEDLLSEYPIDEIDYVFPYSLYLNGYREPALERCRQALALCKYHRILFKVIIETGAFRSPAILYTLAKELIDLGCDFLKTSTGKIEAGATPLSAYTLLKAIKESGKPVGFKASGGIRKPEDAFLYAEMASQMLGSQTLGFNLSEPLQPQAKQAPSQRLSPSFFRIGASSLLDELVRL
ncbi:deoxyribose-phosphate aldolase [Legionella birminghamensis]|nr:deoxyribose-phosphate aldolase [Legionella birminghamensis]